MAGDKPKQHAVDAAGIKAVLRISRPTVTHVTAFSAGVIISEILRRVPWRVLWSLVEKFLDSV